MSKVSSNEVLLIKLSAIINDHGENGDTYYHCGGTYCPSNHGLRPYVLSYDDLTTLYNLVRSQQAVLPVVVGLLDSYHTGLVRLSEAQLSAHESATQRVEIVPTLSGCIRQLKSLYASEE